MIAGGHHAAAQGLASRQAVQPGHRVLTPRIDLGQARHRLVQIGRPVRVDRHPRRRHRLQRERHLGDDAGQAHAAKGCPEQVVADGKGAHLALSVDHLQIRHVAGDAAVTVVVLPVHVRGHRAAERDLPRAGRHGHEPSLRDRVPHQRVDVRARADGDRAQARVDFADGRERAHVEHHAAGVLRGVAVAAAEPAGDDTALRAGANDLRDLVARLRRTHYGRGRRRAAPPGQDLPLVSHVAPPRRR